MAKLYLSLGSNQGDRSAWINQAIQNLDSRLGPHKAISSIITTSAVGFDGPDFLNCVLVYETRKEAESILRMCKEIERIMGRTDAPDYDSEGHRIYHDRIIDIDILKYGNISLSTPELTIPHARLEDRPFFAELMREIDSELLSL